MKILFPVLALAMLQLGCGDDPAASIASDDGGSADGTADAAADETGTDSSPAGDATTDASDGGGGGDAATDAPVDGGVISVPNGVSCGTASCTLPSVCCAQPADGGLSCSNAGCGGGLQRECDEAADCPGAQVCCYEKTANGLTSSCHADCGGGGGTRTQACRLPNECLSGTCAVHACSDGGASSVETCAPISGLCP